MLAESGATVIGVIVNDIEMGGGSSAFSHGAHSGYGYYNGRYGYRGYGDEKQPYAPEGASAPAKPAEETASADDDAEEEGEGASDFTDEE